MKRNQLFALILALCVLLAGCGGNAAQSGDATEGINATEAPTQAAAPEKVVTLGVVEGKTYTNSYVGLGFSLDDNWDVYPAEQLQELPETVEGMFEGTGLEGMEYSNITDFVAENMTDLTTMNLNYSKLSMQERLAYALMDDDAIIDTMLEEYYDDLVAAYANAGITVEGMEKKAVTFLGEQRTALHTVAYVEDIPYFILQIYEYGLGAYGVTLTLGSYIEDNTEGLLDLYYAVE